MITLKRVLVPLDFSECSDAALRYGRALAQAFGARLHLLHVVQDPYSQPWAGEAFVAPIADLIPDWMAEARARIVGLLPEAEREQTTVTTIVGSPFFEIVRYAVEEQVDLIVIGTHGRGPIGHVLLGSVAERVVRKSPCPVLTVRASQHDFVMPERAEIAGATAAR